MKTPAAIAALVLVGACSPAEDATMDATATETAMADDTAMAENTETPAPVDQASSNKPAQEPDPESPEPTSNAIKVAGTLEAIILDAEEPMIEISGQGGAKYLGTAASGQIDTILDNMQGIGSSISLNCQKSDLPPQGGYIWVKDCKLS